MPSITDATIARNPASSDDPFYRYFSGDGILYGVGFGNWTIDVSYHRSEYSLWAYDPGLGASAYSNDTITLRQDVSTPQPSTWIWTGSGDDVVTTSDNDDEIQGDAYQQAGTGLRVGYGRDRISSGGGNDTVGGNGGNDTIDGGAGDDILYGDYGRFRVVTDINGDPADTPTYDPFPTGATFNDKVKGGIGDDSIYGGSGADMLEGGGDDDLIDAGGFFDRGADTVSGGDGADTIQGIGGGDAADAGAGDDYAVVVVNDSIPQDRFSVNGGAGSDRLDLTYVGSKAVDVSVGAAGITTSLDPLITNFEYFGKLETGDGADKVTLYREPIGDQSRSQSIYTFGGNDTIIGAEGKDGAAPDGQPSYSGDAIITGLGDDSVQARSGNDYIQNSGGRDTIEAGSGNDTVVGYGTTDTDVSTGIVSLGAGNDAFRGDTFAGQGIDYTVSGGAGDDVLAPVVRGTYVFKPGDGDDQILVKALSVDTNGIRLYYDLSDANDDDRMITVDYSDALQAVNVDIAAGTADDDGGVGDPDQIDFTDDVVGSKFDDTVSGDDTANKESGGGGGDALFGLGGKDTLLGEAGADLLSGGADDDSLSGGAADDVATGGDANDTVLGDAGDDKLKGEDGTDSVDGGAGDDVVAGGAGDDTLKGGADDDTLSFETSKTAVKVSLLKGVATGEGTDKISGFETLVGSDFKDTLEGADGDDVIRAGEGNDKVDGGEGKDSIEGGDDRDTILGGAGVDTLKGEDGADALDGGADGDSLEGGAGVDMLQGGAGDDSLIGGAGDDTLDGGDSDGDQVSYSLTKGAVVASLITGLATSADGKDTLVGIEVLNGSDFNDTLTGAAKGAPEATIFGGKGSDLLAGGPDGSRLDGGEGVDTVDYGDVKLSSGKDGVNVDLVKGEGNFGTGADSLRDIERILGTAKNDKILGDKEDNELKGASGDDTIGGGAGNDTLDGGAGEHDLATFETASNAVKASLSGAKATGDGTDKLTGFENLQGSDFNDTLTGSSDVNEILGGDGNDSISSGDGADTVFGGTGKDTIDGGDGDKSLKALQELHGGADADRITTGKDNADLFGDAGNDTLIGGAGSCLLDGGKNDDVLKSSGFLGNGLVGGAGNDTLTGGAGSDYFEGYPNRGENNGFEALDVSGDDVIDGGGGDDFVYYLRAKSAVLVDLAKGEAHGGSGDDRLTSIETVLGSAFDDTLIGSSAAETLIGGKGDDSISGGAGNDVIYGSAGADTIDGGDGYDTLNFDSALRLVVKVGDDGYELIDQVPGAKPDKLTSIEKLVGSGEGDVIKGEKGEKEGVELGGGGGADTLQGTAGDDKLDGGDGRDQIKGLGGGDTIAGGADEDALDGGADADRLIGGAGSDRLTGGSGGDVFVFDSRIGTDTVLDFGKGDELVFDASALGFELRAGTLPTGSFVEGSRPVAAGKSASFLYDTDDGALYLDVDGKGGDDPIKLVILKGAPDLSAGDIAII